MNGQPPISQTLNGPPSTRTPPQVSDPRFASPKKSPDEQSAPGSRAASPTGRVASPTMQTQPLVAPKSLDSQMAMNESPRSPDRAARDGPSNQLAYLSSSTGAADSARQGPPSAEAERRLRSPEQISPLSKSAPPSSSDRWLLAALQEAHAAGFRPSEESVQTRLTALDSERQQEGGQQHLLGVILALKQEFAKSKVCCIDFRLVWITPDG